jgi:hypothetical protein
MEIHIKDTSDSFDISMAGKSYDIVRALIAALVPVLRDSRQPGVSIKQACKETERMIHAEWKAQEADDELRGENQ